MKKVKVYHYDAFSQHADKGNPAGVVFNGEDCTEEEMQEIALKVGFNETSFVVQSEAADLRIRYFTPGHEMNLCGHATVATLYALKMKGLLGDQTELMIETKAGILPVKLSDKGITMRQAAPQFKVFNGSIEELAQSLGIEKEDISNDLPIVYGSTGIWTLLVPITRLEVFQKMKPVNEAFPAILKEMPLASVHPFCLETYDPDADMHARHFSSPYSGTIEDAVTGTASGVMGAYYATFIKNNSEPRLELVVEQGQEIGRDGRVRVSVVKIQDQYEVEITGEAVYVGEMEVVIN